MKPPILWFTLAMVVATLLDVSSARTSELSISGYFKNFFVAYDTPVIRSPIQLPDEPLIGSVSNRIRVNLGYCARDWMSVNLSYNILPRIQDPTLFKTTPNLSGISFPSYRAVDLDSRLYPAEDEEVKSFGISHNLDRASVTFSTSFSDISLGRQAIAWGSARAVNPTDVLLPFTFDELDIEDRVGVDAVRIRIPLAVMGELDAGYVFGNDFAFDESAFFLRAKVYAFKTDISSMLIGFRENLLIGADMARSIGGASVWLETAYVFAGALDDRHFGTRFDYLRATIGTDYALTGTLYGFIEYHFSSAGTGDEKRYLDLLSNPAYTDGAVYLLGRNYLIPGISWQFKPLVTLTGQILTNIEDPSLLLAPNVEYNIAENIYLAAGAVIGLGRHPEFNPESADTAPFHLRSEFGGYSDLYFSSFRIYF